jgi:hypothetical protein
MTGLIVGALWIGPAPDGVRIFEFIPRFGKMGYLERSRLAPPQPGTAPHIDAAYREA